MGDKVNNNSSDYKNLPDSEVKELRKEYSSNYD